MDKIWQKLATKHLGARTAEREEPLQALWSGHGEIFRVHLTGCEMKSVIIKHVAMDPRPHHPRGWDSERSIKRKTRSYEVERAWYERWGPLCVASRIPACHGTHREGSESWLVLEDLDASGFDGRFETLDARTAALCLKWLARFHASFLGREPTDLWPKGTYWHLDTRPDEYQTMADSKLKQVAPQIDALLSDCNYQTLVHGDAKVANFCFANDKLSVAAVDFQYVGKGCGMKDVVYFLGSCLDEETCRRLAPDLLDVYFAELSAHCQDETIDVDALEDEWRRLYPVAWTDFYRFLAGWMPTHQKIHGYTRQLAEQTFALLSSL